MATDAGALRIGEFSRRVGVSPELLRAWERRYGLLQPIRSEGGFRLYTDDDAERVARMRPRSTRALGRSGGPRWRSSESARREGRSRTRAARLLGGGRGYDEAAVHSVLDQSLPDSRSRRCCGS